MTGGLSKSDGADDEMLPGRRAHAEPSQVYLPWRPVTPRDDESVRWECVDGRWIAIGLGTGEHSGLARVENSGVLCEYVDTFELALALAKRWRTA